MVELHFVIWVEEYCSNYLFQYVYNYVWNIIWKEDVDNKSCPVQLRIHFQLLSLDCLLGS